MMKLRIALGITAALGVLAAFTTSAAQAEPTEETQAAYVLMGLLNEQMLGGFWIEQTAVSPAVFVRHDENGKAQMTVTISKVGNCQYQLDVDAGDADHVAVVKNLLNADPDKTRNVNFAEIEIPGMTASCKVISGARTLCGTPHDYAAFVYGVAFDHEIASLKAFKAKFCQ